MVRYRVPPQEKLSSHHHYVSQFYLHAFETRDLPGGRTGLWVYDKTAEEPSVPRPQSVRDTAVQSHFYSFRDDEGRRHDAVERVLGRVEDLAKPIMEKWRSEGTRPTADDVAIVLEYVAAMFTRVPRTVEYAKELSGVLVLDNLKSLGDRRADLQRALERYTAEIGVAAPPIERVVETIRDFEQRFTLEVDDRHPLAVSLRMTPVVAAELVRMNWCLLDAPSGSFFITGDCPLTVFTPVRAGRVMFGAGLRRPEAEVTFPLSPTVCLFLDYAGTNRRRRIRADLVREINRRTAFSAERFVFSTYATERVRQYVVNGARSVGLPKVDKPAILQALRARRSQRP